MKDIILKEVSRTILPFIHLFGIYIILHGHLSPGGGFAGGTVLGTGFILYRIVFGKDKAREKFQYSKLVKIMSIALIMYGTIKGYSFISGGSDLNWPGPPLGKAGNILSGGFLLPLNIIVGIIVSITIYFLYSLFEEGEI
ncbi:MnhB domain-containing protein [Clostridium sp. MSJ-11]|uniref:MnhB domain-containing protein n=1 Tax=Clostridium mobile TaxID=2841512 RepID=A0ABS6ECD4_9CLOT|nr:MnhB domain-containing protein [Clostridium mobile]MBU5482849.1 MnhB domain-containing protein [Clostridium mobile]